MLLRIYLKRLFALNLGEVSELAEGARLEIV